MMAKWKKWWQRQDMEALENRAISKKAEGIIDDWRRDGDNGIIEIIKSFDGSTEMNYLHVQTRKEARIAHEKQQEEDLQDELKWLTQAEENQLERGDRNQNADVHDYKAKMKSLREKGSYSNKNADDIMKIREDAEELREEAESKRIVPNTILTFKDKKEVDSVLKAYGM